MVNLEMIIWELLPPPADEIRVVLDSEESGAKDEELCYQNQYASVYLALGWHPHSNECKDDGCRKAGDRKIFLCHTIGGLESPELAEGQSRAIGESVGCKAQRTASQRIVCKRYLFAFIPQTQSAVGTT